ncbi:MAG: helix-turn-helix transcriptional regulator [Spirochaetales bacterium]|nr:helix-turn-helix transcriptional regulator [Spirochaetales bacterium]
MLDKIILGVLSLKDLTSYDLKKSLDKSINHFYTTSYGSLHPALVKLEKNKLVTSREFVEGGRSKKLYSITESGRQDFTNWLSSDIQISRLKEDSLVRIFFFGMLEPEERQNIISTYLQSIDTAMNELLALREDIQQVNVSPDFQDIARYQIETLNYGIDHSHFLSDWFNDFLVNRTKKETEK